MGLDLIFKIAGIGIIVAILNPLLTKAGRDEQATLVTLAGLVLALVLVSGEIRELFNTLKSLFG